MQVAALIRYNHVVRGLYLECFAKMPWSEVVADNGLSFGNIRDVFLHLTLVEDRWVSYVIPGKFKDWVDLDFNAFKDVDSLKRYLEKVKADTEAYLRELSAEELNRQIVIPWGKDPNTRISVETGLTHMVLEDMIHYGELSAALWQMGLDAPYMGFWRFKNMNP